MVKTITQLSVFVSSPGGLDDHRQAVNSAIEQSNRILLSENLSLSPYFWERDAVPGSGKLSAQDVINRELDENTDILVILMHSRAGSSTNSAISGTIEEFERVHSSIEGRNANIHVCAYFCVAPISPLSDFRQLQKVQEFRDRVQSLNYLTKDYEKATDLSMFLVHHLVEKARNCASFSASGESGASIPAKSDVLRGIVSSTFDLDDEEKLGPLDYENIVTEKLQRSTDLLRSVGALVAEYAVIMTADSKRMSESADAIARGLPVDKLSVVNVFAKNLSDHLERFEPVVREFETDFSTGCAGTLSIVQEWPVESDLSATSMIEFVEIVDSVLVDLVALRDVSISIPIQLQSFPGLSQQMKRARNRAIRVYNMFVGAMDRNIETLAVVVEIGRAKAAPKFVK